MAYQIKYTGNFDVMQSVEPFLSVRVDIYEDGYTGDPILITMTGTPVIHEWQDDNPFEPIKGSTCKIGIINDGTVSLDDFYSDEDTKYRVEVRRAETLDALFIGYLLQDDCREIQVDFNHEIFLTATDGLGLIKDVTLGEAAKLYGTPTTTTGVTVGTIAGNSHTIISPDGIFSNLHVGDVFYLSSGALQGYWTVTDVSFLPAYDWYINVAEDTSTFVSPYITNVTYNIPVNINDYISLLTILRLCFKATQLNIAFSVMGTIRPANGSTNRWLEDTYVYGESFSRDGSWMSCYEILEQIMQRFKASAFQSYGRWWVVRWGELYFQNGPNISTLSFQGYEYNTDFSSASAVAFTDYSFSLLFNDIEYGIEKSIIRPIQYAREQFNYVRPELLKNSNLQELGALVDQYDVGAYTYKEYEVPYWVDFSDHPSPTVTRRIRIITESATGSETDRYLFIIGNAWNSTNALQSNNIELSEGDVITWQFDYRTGNSEPGSVTNVFNVWYNYTTGSELRINNFGEWVTPPSINGFSFNVANGDNVQEWHTVTIKSKGVPYDGILRLFLTSASSNNAINETHYRNFSLTVENINNFKKVKGHVHKNTNTLKVKNTTDLEIFIDDSISSAIKGTLFEEQGAAYVRPRTSTWEYYGYPDEVGKLGYLTTLEQQMINHTVRSRYDGSILKIWHGSEDNIRFISNFFVFNILSSGDTRRFVPGSLSIDYKHNRADITLHQLTNWQEEPADVDDYYTFNYIYDNG